MPFFSFHKIGLLLLDSPHLAINRQINKSQDCYFIIIIIIISQVREVQTSVQVKKSKKKTKPDVKPVQQSSSVDGREPDDGKT